jgi:uroporphyrinogen decarboxylase
MERVLGTPFAALAEGDERDLDAFFAHYCGFFREMTYDTVSYEVCITEILPDHGAIYGGKGPIQNRADFERYPGRAAGALLGVGQPFFDAWRARCRRG